MTNAIENISRETVLEALKDVHDPEIPVISVVDLGIISGIEINEEGVLIRMTPTFSGCPAIHFIQDNIRTVLIEKLHTENVEVIVDFETTWGSNRISEKGLGILKRFGLAPPKRYDKELQISDIADISCPYCDSRDTVMKSAFGSTLCRSIHYCNHCLQSFEQFKPV
jgi:ring-1,2-phenylacetyl-CoA epoxidase subunit PaaD